MDLATLLVPYQSTFTAPLISFEPIDLPTLNRYLVAWGHKMGPLQRGTQGAWCHALLHHGTPVAVASASYLIAEYVAGLTRAQAVELSRVCAIRRDLCRVVLRLWREFVFPTLGFAAAVSYQDAALHSGNLYRFDGWQRIAFSHSGVNTRNGKPGRDKWIWVWPPRTSEVQ